jgi:hypothetical protein
MDFDTKRVGGDDRLVIVLVGKLEVIADRTSNERFDFRSQDTGDGASFLRTPFNEGRGQVSLPPKTEPLSLCQWEGSAWLGSGTRTRIA